jgi:hypothetical protein
MISRPFIEAAAARPTTGSPMLRAGYCIGDEFNRATPHQFANVERLSAITVPGASAPGQHEDVK